LDPVKGPAVNYGLVLSLEPFTAIVNLANIGAIFEEVGERTVGEGNSAVVFRDLCISPLSDNASAAGR
jgi:hypothetical protein